MVHLYYVGRNQFTPEALRLLNQSGTRFTAHDVERDGTLAWIHLDPGFQKLPAVVVDNGTHIEGICAMREKYSQCPS